MDELFKNLDYMKLSLIALVVTLVVSAVTGLFNVFFEEANRKKWLVAGVALIITVANNVWIKGETTWQHYLLEFVISWSFAVLFYSYLGLWVVKEFFTKLKDKLSK